MKKMKKVAGYFKPWMWVMSLLLAAFVVGCGDIGVDGQITDSTLDTVASTVSTLPTVISTDPANDAVDVSISHNHKIKATFSMAMDPATIRKGTFTLTHAGMPVAGAVRYSASTRMATFTPKYNLGAGLLYFATITKGAKSLKGNALASKYIWHFTTGTPGAGPAPVDLGTAANYVILSKTGISSVPKSAITGNLGVSPIKASAITGFSLTADSTNRFSTSAQVTGRIYASNYAPPTPAHLTTAVSDMETAFTAAAGRAPDFTELYSGAIGGKTLAPGTYYWSTDLSILTDAMLDGGANDVWIFQIAGNITQAAGKKVILSGGALPKNIFWQVAGDVTIGTNAHFKGIILCQTAIHLQTGASANGRLLAQTAVTLDQSTVVEPAP